MSAAIYAYQCGEAPPHQRWIAVIYAPEKTVKGNPMRILPLMITGEAAEIVLARANEFWTTECAKLAPPVKLKGKGK